jgi:hypothetical protein
VAAADKGGHATVSHFRIALYDMTSGTAEEALGIARDKVIPLFEQQPGFVRYEVGSLDSGGIVSFSLWETEAEALHAEEVAADFVKENLAERVKLREEHTGDLAWDEAR